MNINIKASCKVVGAILAILGGVMVLPFITALIYKEALCAKIFGVICLFTFSTGGLIFGLITPDSPRLKIKDGSFIVVVSWTLCCILGCLPYIFTGAIPNPASAFFEAVSGFTTTGATAVPDVEILPKSILLWRAFTHWIGGMGILMFTVALLPAINIEGNHAVAAETPGPTLTKLTPKISDTARYLYIFYISLTLVAILSLKLCGMNLFDAICHAFSTVATGGFANYNDSILHYNSGLIEMVLVVFMLISATNFNLYFLLYKDGIKTILKDGEWKMYVATFSITSLLTAAGLWFNNEYSLLESLRHAIFLDASLLTTTGFGTVNYCLWPTFCQVMLLLLFFSGGMSSSTSGGIKTIRILVLLKIIKRSIVIRLHPNAIVQIRVNEQLVSKETTANIANFIFAYIGTGMLGAFLISVDGYDFVTSLSASFSCLGSVGPGFGALDPSHSFYIFSDFSKMVASVLMIAGRLEIYTLLMLFSRRYWKSF